MPHDPNALRWMAFTDDELDTITGSLHIAEGEGLLDRDEIDHAHTMHAQVTAERDRRAATHAAQRSAPTPDPDPPRLVVGEPVVVDFAAVPGPHPFGQRKMPALILEPADAAGRIVVKFRDGAYAGQACNVPVAALARDRRSR